MPVIFSAHIADMYRSAGIGKVRFSTKRDAMNACHAHVDLLERRALADATVFASKAATGDAHLAKGNADFAASRRADAVALGVLRGKLASAIPAASQPGNLLDCGHGGYRVYLKREVR